MGMKDIRESKGAYVYHNENPKNLKSSADCVVRAIAKGTNNTWEAVYCDLSSIGLKLKDMPNTVKVYGTYLEQLGFLKQKQPRKSDNTKYTVEEFANNNQKGRYILNIANHLTVVVDGMIYDTWNCSHKTVGNYWKVG